MVRGDANERMRVLLVGRGAPERGGIAVYLDGLLHGPLADQVDLAFLNLSPTKGPGDGGTFNSSNTRRTLADGCRLLRAAGSIDVVHIHSSLGATSTVLRAGWLARCARLRGCRVVVHAHGGKVVSWLDGRRSPRILATCLRPVDEVMAVSQSVAAVLRPVIRASVLFVPNGIDLRPYAKLGVTAATDPPSVLYIGHLSRRKGLVDLRDASRILRRRGIEHVVLVAGGTPDEGAEERALVEREIGDDVVLLGSVEHAEVPELLESATVFCLPSWWEAMPLSIIEAMAAGRPVVATDVGDVPTMVQDSGAGAVVPVGEPAALADALESLLTNPDRCATLGAAGRRSVAARYDISEMSRTIAGRYRALVESGQASDRGQRSS